MKSITIKEVAAAANVSIATVSRVLNNSESVLADTRHAVQKAMKELNYRPNSLARGLKLKRSSTIGYIVSDINMFFTRIMQGVETVLRKQNYVLIVCDTGGKPAREIVYLRTLLEKKVDGIILNTVGGNDDYIAEISHEVPIVLSNRQIEARDFCGDVVDNDNMGDAYTITMHLIEQGHRKIGIINGDTAVSTGRERFEGFVNAMNTVGVEVGEDYPYRFDGDFKRSYGYQAAQMFMNMDIRPTALVIMNNEMTLGAMHFFREHNIRVPEDVSIVTYGDIAERELLYVRPTLIAHNYPALGRKMGELILERIESEYTMANRIYRFSSGLLPGDSTRRI